MAETKLASIKSTAVNYPLDTKPQMAIGAPSSSAATVSFPSDPLRTIWDISIDEITATVFAELRF